MIAIFVISCFKSRYPVQKKLMKQKLQDETAKAVIAQNCTHLSISEHEPTVSEIETEVAQAHTEMLEAIKMVPKSMF